ncbi:MAG: acyltransferase family protein [Terracidiphilus sp.]
MGEKTGKISPFKSLDALRGLAALWVVMCHAADHAPPGAHWTNSPLYFFSIRGQLGVVLFFLISGYCIAGATYSAFASGKSVWRFGFERIRRIYPPYFFTIGLTAAFAAVQLAAERAHWLPLPHHPSQLNGSATFWIANLFLVQVEAGQGFLNVDFWSLCYEIAFYAIAGAILLLARQIVRKWGNEAAGMVICLTFGALTIESLVWQIVTGTGGPFPLDLWFQFGLGGLFFVAMEIKNPALVGFSRKARALSIVFLGTSVGLSALFAVMRSLGGGSIDHPSSRAQCWAAILYLGMFWLLRISEGRFVHLRGLRPLFWLGSFSYSLYLFHPLFRNAADLLERRVGLADDKFPIAWALQIIVSVFASWLCFLAVEKHFTSSQQKRRIANELAEVP